MYLNPSSFWKVMDIIGRLSVEPLEVSLRGEVRVYLPLPLEIQRSFFSNFECQKCGKCCLNTRHDLFWLKKPPEIEVEEFTFEVNSLSKPIYFHRNTPSLPCFFLRDSLCSIHLIKPLHCLMPPIKVDEWEGRVYLQKRLYRNFPCKMEEQEGWGFPKTEFETFKRVQAEAEAIGVHLRREVGWVLDDRRKPGTKYL